MSHTPKQRQSQVIRILSKQDLADNNKEIIKLMQLGRSQGFENLVIRKKVWPILLEVNIQKLHESSNFLEWNPSKQEHSKEYQQLKKDALRSFHSFKPFQNIEEDYLKKKQEELLEVLDALSKNEPTYKYFQGFHDIASIFISMFGMNTAYYMSHKLATTYLRDSFLMSFDQTVMILDKLIWEIVVQKDSDFKELFQQFDQHRLGFTMSWIITWFAHNFQDINIISRIWDYLISSQPSAIVYVSAAFIIESKEKLISYIDEMGGGYDVGIVHTFFQNLKSHNLNIEAVLRKAVQLEKEYPLSKLQPSKQLKDTTVIRPENFIKHFQIHQYLHKLLFQKAKKTKHIKYALLIGATVLMVVAAIWKRKSIWEWLGVGMGGEL